MILDDIVLATFGHYSGSALMAIDFDSGEELWRYEDTNSMNTPVVVNDEIYVTNLNGRIIRLDRCGDIVWEVQPLRSNLSPPVVTDTAVVYVNGPSASPRYLTNALSRSDGSLIWAHEHTGLTPFLDADSTRVVHSVITNKTRYLASGPAYARDVELRCLDSGDGSALWVTKYEHDADNDNQPYLFSSTIVDDEVVLVGARGEVRMYSLATGKLRSTFPLTDSSDVVIRPGTAAELGFVFRTESGGLLCLAVDDRNEMQLVWEHTAPSAIQSYAIVEGQVVAITESALLLWIDQSTGDLRRTEKISGPFKRGFGLAFKDDDLILAVAAHCRRVSL